MSSDDCFFNKVRMKLEAPMAKMLNHVSNDKQAKLIRCRVPFQKTKHSRPAPFTWKRGCNFQQHKTSSVLTLVVAHH